MLASSSRGGGWGSMCLFILGGQVKFGLVRRKVKTTFVLGSAYDFITRSLKRTLLGNISVLPRERNSITSTPGISTIKFKSTFAECFQTGF